MKKVTMIDARDKKKGMSIPEIQNALKGFGKDSTTVKVSINISGHVKRLTVTQIKEEPASTVHV